MTIKILFSNDITFVSAINMILYLNRKMQFLKQNYRLSKQVNKQEIKSNLKKIHLLKNFFL